MTMTTEVRERPVLFSGPMVRAILEGRKVQTRRVVKPQPPAAARVQADPDLAGRVDRLRWSTFDTEANLWDSQGEGGFIRCPYGRPGDRLWVREMWAAWSLVGAGDLWRVEYAADRDFHDRRPPADWTPPKALRGTEGNAPSIHMPRWASRITLEITDVRVERLGEIAEEDVIAEGISTTLREHDAACDLRDQFRTLWDSLNAERGYSFDSSPWVWVISFRRLEAPHAR